MFVASTHSTKSSITLCTSSSLAKDTSSKVQLVETDDHPLSTNKSSTWYNYFRDQELWDEIEKDTLRTRADMHFFSKPTGRARKYITHSKRKEAQIEECHNEVILRILFIYSKLNPGIGYVQGMNEILAPIYYCFATDENADLNENYESDAFFCFTNLMGELKDSFLRQLDPHHGGIKSRIQALNELLKRADADLWEHLERNEVNPQFYSLRWLMLMLTQEFLLSEVNRLWDTLLAYPQKLVYLNYICLGIIVIQKDTLLESDFSEILPLLQRLNQIDLGKVLVLAAKLRKEFPPANSEGEDYFNQTNEYLSKMAERVYIYIYTFVI
eukprot:TRINITY_DN12948_c0_g1_i2.p1 TRINITY_DN12948_c0_g1~~TRINITY_DN12948_c0_g1_i2.p1  ORF type:complete len:327 (-),score=64.45 TRINITY_DN12948_c0_g1_i2:257-1237(-)